jgi:hypothetical protein
VAEVRSRGMAVFGAFVVSLVLASALSAAPPAVDAEVLAVREAAWRAWFSGDEAALRRMLPADFIGLDGNGGPLVDLEATLARSKAFHASGARLVKLDFPETRAQAYGDVVILYGRFTAVLAIPGADGAAAREQPIAGRLTEMFLRQDGRWLHTGWHLDSFPAP